MRLWVQVPSEGSTYQPGLDVEGCTVAPSELVDTNKAIALNPYSFHLFVSLDEMVPSMPGITWNGWKSPKSAWAP